MTVRGGASQRRIALQAVIERDDVQHVQVLPLVFVEALDLDVEQRLAGSTVMPVFLQDLARRGCACSLCLTRAPLRRGRRRRRPAARARAAVSRSRDPAVADRVGDELRQLRVASAAMKRRGVTPLVTLQNFSGHISSKSRSTSCLSSSRVQRGDAVDRVAADAGEVRHAHRTCSPASSMSDSRARARRRPDSAAAPRRGSGG